MSYDVSLHCPCCTQVVRVEPHTEGGTYELGGSDRAALNVTYNYAPHFRRWIDPEGLCWLDGKTAEFTLTRLLNAVQDLKGERGEDYWAPTEGNARHALSILVGWARLHPKAYWSVV